MKLDKKSMSLYVVTDRTWLKDHSLSQQVEEAILGGATFIQIREKDLDKKAYIKEALNIRKVTQHYHIPFVVNDDIQVAIEVNADGVHVGQKDMEVAQARQLIGNNKILGVSAKTVEQALRAQKKGADYIGVGAVFSTATKHDADHVSYETIKQICSAVSIPVVAIGGINESNIMMLKGSGVNGVAVVSAVFSQPDIKKAASNLLKLSKEMIENESSNL